MKRFSLVFLSIFLTGLIANAQRYLELFSPDKTLKLEVRIGDEITYRLVHHEDLLIDHSRLSLTLESGEIWGHKAALRGVKKRSQNSRIDMPFGVSQSLDDHFNELELRMKKDWIIEFRLYNEGFAYRFVSDKPHSFNIEKEEVAISFPGDLNTYANYVVNRSNGKFETKEQQLNKAFENVYTNVLLSGVDKNRLIQLPLLVEGVNGKKICITESDLEAYPGMYLVKSERSNELNGFWAQYPKDKKQGGFRNIQMQVTTRESFIAKIQAKRSLPWRVFIIATTDEELLTSELVYKLASPSRINDVSWIQPGQVVWDWWHDNNILDLDFKVGMNTATYKYYIDFAADKGIKYIIIDEGWSDKQKADLMQVVPEMDIKELADYGKRRNVGVILWAGYWAFERNIEAVCKYYSEMGIRGFKLDYLNRDDQEMVDFVYKAASTTAKYKMILDLHGMYKPTGVQRTYPNVLNFEGVMGLENMKWADSLDLVTNDVVIPFIRMTAEPLDYTPGAMRNATKRDYKPNYWLPMSQGTRTRQLAMYVIYKGALQMLSDSPSAYLKEIECLNFIKSVPTVWDKTIAINGSIKNYVTMARQKGSDWWVGGMTNWEQRDMNIDLSFLPAGNFELTLFRDGVNADKWAADYRKEIRKVTSKSSIPVTLKPGGGFVMHLKRIGG